MSDYKKFQTTSKQIVSKPEAISGLVLSTMDEIARIVGSTLGPSGRPVLIERHEMLPPVITKDGVTVFKALGFSDASKHMIMESVRDAATRTASSAGDGPQPLWSKVLTPTGFVPMGEIRMGMKICGTNGSIQEVLAVYPKGQKEIYKVTFSEDRVVECCHDHLWSVTTNYGFVMTLTTGYMSACFKFIENDDSIRYRYFTPFYHTTELKEDQYGDKIINIEATGQFTEMQCIKVSNPDNLYITDNFIVTHNTTTATILANSIIHQIHKYCQDNPKASPQKTIRDLRIILDAYVMPEIKNLVIKCSLSENKDLLKTIAEVSANGDTELANAVLDCFEQTGDAGNVTLLEEMNAVSRLEVQKIDGYPIHDCGWHSSVEPYGVKYINDTANQQTVLENPYFLIVYGQVNDLGPLMPLLEIIGQQAIANPKERKCVVLVATGFSETIKASLGASFATPHSVPKVFPLLAPPSPLPNGTLGLLQDLCIITGQKELFDPISKPLSKIWIEDLGTLARRVEIGRFRSNVFADTEANELELVDHVENLERQMQAAAKLEQLSLQERIGKLTGGIARLKILGSSSGELRERRDRAEDAVCAVRGALKYGALPGGASVLTYLAGRLQVNTALPESKSVLVKSLLAPISRLLENSGYVAEEASSIVNDYLSMANDGEGIDQVWDLIKNKWIVPTEGLLDSAPAVIEALNNSFSIASLLGTCGGLVSFPRDPEFERQEAKANYSYARMGNMDV